MKIIRTPSHETGATSEDNEAVIATCENPVEAVLVARALTHFTHNSPYRYAAVPDSYQLKTFSHECHA